MQTEPGSRLFLSVSSAQFSLVIHIPAQPCVSFPCPSLPFPAVDEFHLHDQGDQIIPGLNILIEFAMHSAVRCLLQIVSTRSDLSWVDSVNGQWQMITSTVRYCKSISNIAASIKIESISLWMTASADLHEFWSLNGNGQYKEQYRTAARADTKK